MLENFKILMLAGLMITSGIGLMLTKGDLLVVFGVIFVMAGLTVDIKLIQFIRGDTKWKG